MIFKLIETKRKRAKEGTVRVSLSVCHVEAGPSMIAICACILPERKENPAIHQPSPFNSATIILIYLCILFGRRTLNT